MKNPFKYKQITLPLFLVAQRSKTFIALSVIAPLSVAFAALVIFTAPLSASAAFSDINWGVKVTFQPDGLVLSETDSSNFSGLTIPNLVRAVNKDREAAGLHPLRRDLVLDEAAALKAADMVANKYFAHSSPDGVNPWHWFKQAEYDYYYAGENLALDFDSAEEVQAAWMNSPKHKENILNPVYDDVGYAIAYGTFTNINGTDSRPRTGVIIVQLFGKRLPSNNIQVASTDTLDTPATLGDFQKTVSKFESGSLAATVQSFSNKLFYDIDSSPIAYQTNDSSGTSNSSSDYPTSPWQYIGLGLAAIMITASTRYALI